jgi:hypothetical protein
MGKIKGSNPDPDNYRDGTGGTGNLIFYSYNGNNYVRTAAGERSKKSWSDRQAQNRKRFSALNDFRMQFSNTQIGQIWRVAEEEKIRCLTPLRNCQIVCPLK